jgi:carbamoyl-phosphate synthase small subunit
VAVLDLGIRRSQLAQLALCCRPVVFPHDASEETVLACRPAGVFISDGPGGVLPPAEVARTVAALLGKAPLLGCGLGHVALGLAAGCRATFLKRGHHGANYPVRNLVDGTVEVTEQRHTVMLDRDSVQASRAVSLLAENINDGSVEGIRSPDARSAGLQFTLAAHAPGTVNVHIRRFVDALAKGAP